jgi:hypothetical protein
VRVARRVRRAGRGNGLAERPAPRPGPTHLTPAQRMKIHLTRGPVRVLIRMIKIAERGRVVTVDPGTRDIPSPRIISKRNRRRVPGPAIVKQGPAQRVGDQTPPRTAGRERQSAGLDSGDRLGAFQAAGFLVQPQQGVQADGHIDVRPHP